LVSCSSSVSAQATRTWVSGVGDDANPCSRTAPCKTFAGAISKPAAGGEIDVLDPGGFGAVTITKSITIDGGPNAGGILNAGTNGVIINALATDTVTLRNVSIQGIGSGLNGIRILAAGTVNVENCVIVNNAQKGIDAQPSTGLRLFVSDTIIRGNTNGANGGGIFLKPSGAGNVTAILNRVQVEKNTFGLRVEDNTTTSARDSSFSNNDTHGIVAVSATAVVNLDGCTMSRNVSSGLRSATGATIRYGKCMIVNNATGLDSVGGNLISFTNNSVAGNTIPGAATGTIPLQ
jgi:hypothetical protein